jgi:hypothetical protein
MGSITGYDINADGYDEFIFSFAYKAHFQFLHDFKPTYLIRRGLSPMFYSFPDSILWTAGGALYSSQLIPVNDTSYLAAQAWAYSYYSFNWDYNNDVEVSSKYIRVLGAAGESLVFYNGCSWTYEITMGCAGNIVVSDPYTEVITHCAGCNDSSGLRMHRMIRADSAELVWVRPNHNSHDMIYLPEIPGSFFAFCGIPLLSNKDTLFQFDAEGNRVQFVTPVPTGTRSWVYPFGTGKPYLQTIVGNTVTLYDVDVTTAVDDGGGKPSTVPDMLVIGAPHPNPFNSSQLIPISAKPGQQLTVTVFNLLGQNVARIYDGRVTTSQFAIPWIADTLPSGIYLIRATSGDETVTVKSILVK